MTVSVCCITYNHEKFIADAIEGFLMQQTKFPVEMVIGEDGSSDKTKEICEAYQRKYPDKIRLLPTEGNLGMMRNFRRTLAACTGKYTAICEGDDYWTDPQKLQIQVDFLENNPDYAICFHRVYELEKKDKRISTLYGSVKEETYSINDLANENIMHTTSVVYRSGLFHEFPEWFHESPVGDYVLHMMNARHGKIKYLPAVMAVYRIHADGGWSQKELGWVFKRWVKVLDFLSKEDFSPK